MVYDKHTHNYKLDHIIMTKTKYLVSKVRYTSRFYIYIVIYIQLYIYNYIYTVIYIQH